MGAPAWRTRPGTRRSARSPGRGLKLTKVQLPHLIRASRRDRECRLPVGRQRAPLALVFGRQEQAFLAQRAQHAAPARRGGRRGGPSPTPCDNPTPGAPTHPDHQRTGALGGRLGPRPPWQGCSALALACQRRQDHSGMSINRQNLAVDMPPRCGSPQGPGKGPAGPPQTSSTPRWPPRPHPGPGSTP